MPENSDRRAPSNTQILEAILSMHGDVRVALDRTVNHEKSIGELRTQVQSHGQSISEAKGGLRVTNLMIAIVSAVGVWWEVLGRGK